MAEIVTGGERWSARLRSPPSPRRHGARVVRVDSGGSLIGALLRGRLVDELSFLVHPVVGADSGAPRWYGGGETHPSDLSPIAAEPLDDGLVWLRYDSLRPDRRRGR